MRHDFIWWQSAWVIIYDQDVAQKDRINQGARIMLWADYNSLIIDLISLISGIDLLSTALCLEV